MANIRVTMYFSAGYYSWTESWWLSASDFKAAAKPAQLMASFRAPLLGFGARLDEVRLTTDMATRQVYFLPPDSFARTGRFDDSIPGITTADEPYSAVLVKVTSVDGYEKISYLSGFPDGIVTVGDVVPATKDVGPLWLQLFNGWKAEMRAVQARWRSKTRQQVAGTEAPIIGIQINALPPGEVGVITAAGFPALPAGEELQIKGASRISGPNPRQLNGNWFVSSSMPVTSPVPGNIFYLRHSQAVDVSQLIRYGTLSAIDYEYRTFDDATIDSATHRKRGVRTGRPLGRSKTR